MTQAERPHGITAYWTAFGWTWSCRCGIESKGNGAARTQAAAYAYGEKHIRNALRRARAAA